MIERRWGLWTLLAAVLVLSFALLGGPASADPASDLSDAESRAASAEADIAAAQQQLDAARAEHATASGRASSAAQAVRAARAEVRALRARLLDRQQGAQAEIAELEATQHQEEDDHDDEVNAGIGLGLAALAAAAIALAWGWFRASAVVTALLGVQLGQAVALCLGGGFLLVVLGAAMGAVDGLLGALGMSIFCLGFILPTALLLGRHSVEVQRGGARAVLGRERLPRWVKRGVALLLFLLSVGALGTAILTEDPTATQASPRLRDDADALASGPGAARLEEAKAELVAARKQAAGPLARQRAARVGLSRATRAVRSAEDDLVDAEADERRFARRLAALVAREEREAEAQADREAEEFEEEETVPGCDPNYSGCVPPYPPDVDCAEVGGSVSVYGSDPHGLDADGDGVGCE